MNKRINENIIINILNRVQKPGRYSGGEYGSAGYFNSEALNIVISYPDLYEIGMSNLSVKILYNLYNSYKNVACERVFAPAPDFEEELRNNNIPLFSLESRIPLSEFDIIGFSVGYELNFTNILAILELGGIPPVSSERSDSDSIVILGGPALINPVPYGSFADCVFIGEAEGWSAEMIPALAELKSTGAGRREMLSALRLSPYIWFKDKAENTKRGIWNGFGKGAVLPSLVSNISTVQDHGVVEIMRGCPHNCRFCSASVFYRPYREIDFKDVVEKIDFQILQCGYREVTLSSLSTGDYPQIEELARRMNERFKRLGIKISLPSLRVRDLSSSSMGGLLKKTGLTFAPETGSDRLRSLIGKNLTNQEVIEKSNLALRSGWKRVKLYFMMGLPGERDEDIEAIIDLSSKIRNVTLSLSYFIPKPHSEFEGKKMEGLDVLREKKKYLYSVLDARYLKKKIKIHFHNLEMSMIEAVLSRGDRKMGSVIYKAWKSGARLQAWTEYFDYGLWEGCFEECGLAPDIYLGEKKTEGPLPWSFIEADRKSVV